MISSPRRRLLLATLLLIAIVAGGAWLLMRRSGLPGRDSPQYKQYQRAFQIGVAALEAGRDDLAEKNLRRAVELIPEEPAGWANLGLLSLRRNDLDDAGKYLKKAAELAPDDGAIEALLGLLAEKQGRLQDAVAHLRKAALRQPHDLASLFTLAEVVSRAGGPQREEEYERLLEQILRDQPNNLRVLLELARAAERRKDRQQVRAVLERLGKLTPEWNDLSRKTFEETVQAVDKAPENLALQLQFLDNVLKAERSYRRDSLAIRPRLNVTGTPLTHFLRLEPPLPSPAPPDLALDFEFTPLSRTPTAHADRLADRWDVVRPVWQIGGKQYQALLKNATDGGTATPGPDTFRPVLFLANAREVRRADSGKDGNAAAAMPFPSGPRQVPPSPAGVLALDWNNDFREDLLLAGAGGLRFWQQQTDGSFTDVADKTGLSGEVLKADYFGAWAADIDMDGDLDIIVARSNGAPLLLRNNRDGTFKNMEIFSAVKDVRGFCWADLDQDGVPDAVLIDAAGKLHVFANERSGQFRSWPLPENLPRFLAMTVADVNGDGVPDIAALRPDGQLVRISDQGRRQSWQVAGLAMLAIGKEDAPGTVTIFAEDLDNNGALDLIVSAPRSTSICLADQGKFAPLPRALDLRVTAVVDVNRDGRLDLVGLGPEGPMQAVNRGQKSYRWQKLWPLANPAAGDERINSFAVGAEVEVRAGSLVQKLTVGGPGVHFGLGDESAADVVRIVWPNGLAQYEFDVPTDVLITASQRLSGSCPFLFTWDGTRMRFAGDFMWGTPLGMFVNGQNIGEFPQTTEWLKIPGEALVPKDGYYDVRVQANLWETDFFDHLALIVVDHPLGTEIHVDERFFLTPTKPKLHVTTPAKPVAHAWDHEGSDVTELVRAIDGRYLDHAGRGRFQGVTRDHWVEVDLGNEAPREGPVLLVARGWLHPTNSSINAALAQGGHEMPRPLTLEVPDGRGGWKTALPALGFPAGKNKTMLIRLDGIDGPGVCRRFRLRTNLEIFWDFLGYATELSTQSKDDKVTWCQGDKVTNDGQATLSPCHAVTVSCCRLAPSSAELRYRGILAMNRRDKSCPEIPEYDKVIRSGQEWRDLSGFHTRFGDVRELLAAVDDRYVIMNAGDEIALHFPVPAGPNKTWQRDFIWECDGWTRDGDFNTRHGGTVLPLPAHGSRGLANHPGTLEDDPVYRRFPHDWRTYHTRWVSGDEFARGLWLHALPSPAGKKK